MARTSLAQGLAAAAGKTLSEPPAPPAAPIPSATEAVEPTPARRTAPKPRKATPAQAKTSKGRPRIGIYMGTEEAWNDAKGAFMWEGTNVPDSPVVFSDWASAAISRYARLSTRERAAKAPTLTSSSGGSYSVRNIAIDPTAEAELEAAVGADQISGREGDSTARSGSVSKSRLAGEAIALAVEDVRRRAGVAFKPYPGPLPQRIYR